MKKILMILAFLPCLCFSVEKIDPVTKISCILLKQKDLETYKEFLEPEDYWFTKGEMSAYRHCLEILEEYDEYQRNKK